MCLQKLILEREPPSWLFVKLNVLLEKSVILREVLHQFNSGLQVVRLLFRPQFDGSMDPRNFKRRLLEEEGKKFERTTRMRVMKNEWSRISLELCVNILKSSSDHAFRVLENSDYQTECLPYLIGKIVNRKWNKNCLKFAQTVFCTLY